MTIQTPAGRARTLTMLREIGAEYEQALEKHDQFNSAHEGYAVLLEELEELWEQVRLKKKKRSARRMRAECVQIAAMAVKFAMRFGS